ncbi:hypothetical protein GTN31_04940 [Macrococcoides canis]|uniref:hypothetical protein n=1 Tax=Macrococcoides canis TaxID=1855823 RepID=UPI0013E95C1A|nr:hypothetical protein [Macrococcus canis]QIH75695.1 hypothetical protein GTN31_04940 [Macrococcus canis]
MYYKIISAIIKEDKIYTFENLVIESNGGTSSWISIWIPPIIALIGVIITLILNNRQNIKNNNFLESLKHVELEATIVRTTRFKWVDEVRDILSELMAVAYRIERNSKRKVNIKGAEIVDFNKKEKILLKIEEDFLRFNLLINKLRYYISPYSFEKNEVGKYISKKIRLTFPFSVMLII